MITVCNAMVLSSGALCLYYSRVWRASGEAGASDAMFCRLRAAAGPGSAGDARLSGRAGEKLVVWPGTGARAVTMVAGGPGETGDTTLTNHTVSSNSNKPGQDRTRVTREKCWTGVNVSIWR